MTPDEIAKLIPDEVVGAAITHGIASGWTPHPSLVKIVLAAGLAAWPGMGQHFKRNGWEKDFLSLPLQEHQNDQG
jgi:hypothetical protein